jgi:L-tyrosine C(3)-methyltransferase
VRQIAAGAGLSLPSTKVLLLGTTSLGLTTKNGDGYHNCEIITEAFGSGLWPVLRDIVEFQARIAYLPATDYAESLRTGDNVGIRRFPGDTRDFYTRLANSESLEPLFYRGMNSWSRLSNPVLLEGIDYSGVDRVLDIGGGDGGNAIALASTHPHLRITVLDGPAHWKWPDTRSAQRASPIESTPGRLTCSTMSTPAATTVCSSRTYWSSGRQSRTGHCWPRRTAR